MVFEDLQWADPTTLGAAGPDGRGHRPNATADPRDGPAGSGMGTRARPGAAHPSRTSCRTPRPGNWRRLPRPTRYPPTMRRRSRHEVMACRFSSRSSRTLSAAARSFPATPFPRHSPSCCKHAWIRSGPRNWSPRLPRPSVVSSSISVLEESWLNFGDVRAPGCGCSVAPRPPGPLLDAQLVEPTEHEGLLRFRHMLVRDAAYQTQLMSDRKVRHLATAQVLAGAKAADPVLKAFHFDHAAGRKKRSSSICRPLPGLRPPARSPRSSRTPLGVSRCCRR